MICRPRFSNILSFRTPKNLLSFRYSNRQASADEGETSGKSKVVSLTADKLGGAVNDGGSEGSREITLNASARDRFTSFRIIVEAV
jgi:hypothetical protein